VQSKWEPYLRLAAVIVLVVLVVLVAITTVLVSVATAVDVVTVNVVVTDVGCKRGCTLRRRATWGLVVSVAR